jgi:hypothetical protein
MLPTIPILSGVISLAETWLDSRAKVSEATAIARAEILKKSIDNEAAWENIQAQNSDRSWKDEYWTIILSLPLIMSFIPGLQPYVDAGFSALQQVPEWYMWSVGIAISSSFGLRVFAKWVTK